MESSQTAPQERRESEGRSTTRKALTIGAVSKILANEFEDVSISKIRYLEDQKLLSPRRTPGGYRLYSQDDVERLRAILRMQRDEFLPLRVIRQELAAGNGKAGSRRERRAVSIDSRGEPQIELDELCDRAGLGGEAVSELEQYGILQPIQRNGVKLFEEADLEIARACAELARFGVSGRHLRVFRSSADREASLIEQLVGPSLRSSNQARRREAKENIESLAMVCNSLTQLLMLRDLRALAGDG